MTKVTMAVLALAALAACEATTTGPADPTMQDLDRPANATNPPGAQGAEATPWWGL